MSVTCEVAHPSRPWLNDAFLRSPQLWSNIPRRLVTREVSQPPTSPSLNARAAVKTRDAVDTTPLEHRSDKGSATVLVVRIIALVFVAHIAIAFEGSMDCYLVLSVHIAPWRSIGTAAGFERRRIVRCYVCVLPAGQAHCAVGTRAVAWAACSVKRRHAPDVVPW